MQIYPRVDRSEHKLRFTSLYLKLADEQKRSVDAERGYVYKMVRTSNQYYGIRFTCALFCRQSTFMANH